MMFLNGPILLRHLAIFSYIEVAAIQTRRCYCADRLGYGAEGGNEVVGQVSGLFRREAGLPNADSQFILSIQKVQSMGTPQRSFYDRGRGRNECFDN
jgi:hypothetical protein